MLDDPTGNSFLQSGLLEEDPDLSVTHYQRTPQQDQELGVTTLPTEDTENNDSVCMLFMYISYVVVVVVVYLSKCLTYLPPSLSL